MADATIGFLSAQGVMLVYGVTALMLAGAAVALFARGSAAVLRQRACEMGVLAALVWLVLACVPLPRVGWAVDEANRAVGNWVATREPTAVSVSVLEIPAELIAKPQAGDAASQGHGPVPAAEPVAVVASPRKIDVRPWIARLFFIGAAGCAGWLVLGQALLWRLVRRSVIAPEAVLAMVDARLRAGRRTSTRSVESRPAVLVTPGLSRPVTCGVWRPTILLPPGLLEEGCARQLRQVVLHELGHVQQRDGWGNLLFCVALPVLYFHPLYWWLRRSASLARELVADDWAARADGKEAYVSELVALARTRMTGVAGPIGAIGILQNRSHFYRRMRMLLQRQIPLATRCSNGCRAAMVMVTVMAVVVMAAMVGVRPARGQTAAPGATAEKGAVDTPIGPQDLLEITMIDETDGSVKSALKAQVNEKGNVSLPLIGTVKAVGLTKGELEQAISQTYRDKNLSPSKVSVKFIEKGQMPAAYTHARRKAIEEFTTTQISMVDATMRKITAERDAIAARVEELRAKGLGDDQPEMAKARDELALTEEKMQAYAREWRDLQKRLQNDAPQRPGAAAADRGAAPGGPVDYAIADISKFDQLMQEQQANRDALAARIAQLRANGAGNDSPELMKARAELGAAEQAMKELGNMQARFQHDLSRRRGPATPIPLLPAPGAQAPPGAAAVGGVQLDLVNLANSLVDAAGAVRVAKVNLEGHKRSANAGGGGQVEVAIAESNLQTAAKRLELLKGIASIALEGARTDAKRAEQLYKQGAESEQAFSEAISKQKMLELIVKGVE